MQITLPTELTKQVELELASGRYHDFDQLIADAVRYFLEDRQRGQRLIEALRRIGEAVDRAGLYERTLIPDAQ